MKTRTLLYHTCFWLAVYLLWVLLFRSPSVAISKTITIEFCYLIFIAADYYIITYLIIPHFLNKRRYALFVCACAVIIAVSALLRSLLAMQMNQYFFKPGTIVSFGDLYLNSLFNISFWVMLISVAKLISARAQTDRQLEQSEKEKIKNELDYLKARINPHALFNSLNTIYGHIDKNNPTARQTLLQFSELLRYQLYECNAGLVTLGKEIGYIKNYIAFQRLRKEERLTLVFDAEDIDPSLQIAPLLFVVLIENAFKFVSNFADAENSISIQIHTKNNMLYSRFTNTKEAQPSAMPEGSGGIGIANLIRRLELLYPGKYELKTRSAENSYETDLKINLL